MANKDEEGSSAKRTVGAPPEWLNARKLFYSGSVPFSHLTLTSSILSMAREQSHYLVYVSGTRKKAQTVLILSGTLNLVAAMKPKHVIQKVNCHQALISALLQMNHSRSSWLALNRCARSLKYDWRRSST